MSVIHSYVSNSTMQKIHTLKKAAGEDLSGNEYAAILLEQAVDREYALLEERMEQSNDSEEED